MIPTTGIGLRWRGRIPRESGDDPPPTIRPGPPHVFPARAGMIHGVAAKRPGTGRIPRESGDDPACSLPFTLSVTYSPRERG